MPKGPKTNRIAQEEYISEYFKCGGVKYRAAKKLGLAYSQVRKWHDEDEVFRERLAEVESEWFDSIRAALMKRAIEKSDQAAFFFLKSKDPEQYDDNIRKAKWLADRGLVETQLMPVQVELVRGPELEEPLEH